MATRKVTVTLDEAQLDQIRSLVQAQSTTTPLASQEGVNPHSRQSPREPTDKPPGIRVRAVGENSHPGIHGLLVSRFGDT
jgi:hypothetical protein